MNLRQAARELARRSAPADPAPKTGLSEAQQRVLDALTRPGVELEARADGGGTLIEGFTITEVRATTIAALKRAGRIEFRRGGGAPPNRYRPDRYLLTLKMGGRR